MKKTKINVSLLLVAVLVSVTTSAWAGGEKKAVKRLSADFEMIRTLKVLADEVRSSGKITMGGPGLLRWEMLSPSRSVLVVNGDKAWIHYPDMGVTKGFDLGKDPVMAVMSKHLLALTGGRFEEMEGLYEISQQEEGVKRLIPKDKSVKKVFASMEVKMTGPKTIEWVNLVSASGDSTRIVFKNVRHDPKIDPSLFEKPGN